MENSHKLKQKLEKTFLNENSEYKKGQFWVFVMAKPYDAKEKETMTETLQRCNWALRYPLEDFLNMIGVKV